MVKKLKVQKKTKITKYTSDMIILPLMIKFLENLEILGFIQKPCILIDSDYFVVSKKNNFTMDNQFHGGDELEEILDSSGKTKSEKELYYYYKLMKKEGISEDFFQDLIGFEGEDYIQVYGDANVELEKLIDVIQVKIGK
jgi:hypothetical protein